ncbi:IucA/IucC family protein [Streptomyces sp. bgisy154]|uniref:IucA/IucC family protein n=1 Tax=Streptomyces sp. bgisy154 TaxID=3413794 RepID=UPI003D75B977
MTPSPSANSRPHTPTPPTAPSPFSANGGSVPRQPQPGALSRRPGNAGADPLDQADPHSAAQSAAVENLLRCWVRETGVPTPADGVLHIPLPASATTLFVPLHHWSPTGWHRFGPPRLADAPAPCPPLDAVTVAALLAREAGHDGARHPRTPTPADTVELVARVADSVRRTATFIAERRARPADGNDQFLSAEQALVLGHPLHPTPKSREGLSEAEAARYSPESRGSFPVHWLAVSPSVLATDSAWTQRGRAVPADQLTSRLAGAGLPLPDGWAALPLHPWQARTVGHRPEVAALFDAGLLRDLGPHGSPWHPTSSVRTVYRSGAPAMLKLSLGLSITNSRRENLRKELHRGVEVHRLLRAGLFRRWQAAHPGFDIVRDPAWLAVDAPDGTPVAGLDVVLRHNPFAPSDAPMCVAGLCSPRPQPPATTDLSTGLPNGLRTVSSAGCDTGHPGPDRAGSDRPAPGLHGPNRPGPGRVGSARATAATRSRLAVVVAALAARTGRPLGAVAAEWFLRYLREVVRPVLWLDGEAGVALEAHQQNTLVLLDPDGWPVGGRYRDNQGYYFRQSRHGDLDALLPGIGSDSDTFVPDEVADERFAYYLGINNVLGLIGAFGSQRLADEELLLAAFRRFLQDAARGPHRLRSTLPDLLLDSPRLRCKANLLTRLHGLDELAGPVDTQSVYVTITNPLHL